MAEPTDNNENKDASAASQIERPAAGNAADLHLPQIIAALHQNAISKCTGDLGDKFRISNSALDGDGDNIKLTSAGQHIISVIPVKADDKVPKKTAVKALKTYVSWFVGPDLASKINDSTVKSLNEAPGNEKNESIKPFMTFSQFLHEAEEEDPPKEKNDNDVEFDGDEPDEEAADVDDSTIQIDDEDKKDSKKDDKKDGKKDSEEKKEDESIESKLGYYVPYELKVEGLKQTALKDSMKKFAMNFFDDLKITASGLFGGGDSFTIKDIKSKIRDVFGPIDPDKLVQNVIDRIEKKYKSDDRPDVKIQQKDTLISDLGSYINGKQKQQIETADYSLYIKVSQDDPKNEIFTPRVIADIVQSSITGLYKKFKNKVTASDVIYIPEYRDIHADTKKIRALYNNVATPDDIRVAIKKAEDANDAHSKVEKLIDKTGKNPNRQQCDRAQKCYEVWTKFNDEWKKNGDNVDSRQKLKNDEKYKYFEKFEKEYAKAYNDNEDASLKENIHIKFAVTNKMLSNIILESMFGKTEFLHEEENKDSKNVAKSIKDYVLSQVKNLDYGPNNTPQVICDEKDKVLGKLQMFNVLPDSVNDSHKNAVAIIPNIGNLDESAIHDDIMRILFEQDEDATSKKKKKISEKDIKKILQDALNNNNIKDIGSFVAILPKTKEDDTKIVSNSKKVYLMFFGDKALESGSNSNDAEDASSIGKKHPFNSGNSQSLFIIPMPGLKYEDSEYANTNV